MTAVHQFVPYLAARDAVGEHTLRVQETLRGVGIESEIYAGEAQPDLRSRAEPFRAFRGDAGAWLLYQSSVGSPVAGFVLARPERKLLHYHNITPPGYFEAWEPHVAWVLAEGRVELAEFAERAVLGLADSGFNEGELRAVGFTRTAVVPVLVDVSVGEVDEVALGRLEEGRGRGAVWLFVGRVAPNKMQHEVVEAFALYRRVFDPGARLRLVGGVSSPVYEVALRALVDRLGLGGVVELAGSVSSGELVAHYRSADVFVCLSEHEGFCVPVLEAMAYGVPVVALAAAAVPGTVGEAGVLLERSSRALVAEAVARVVSDAGLRAGLLAAGRRRVEAFSLERGRRLLLDALLPLLDERVPA